MKKAAWGRRPRRFRSAPPWPNGGSGSCSSIWTPRPTSRSASAFVPARGGRGSRPRRSGRGPLPRSALGAADLLVIPTQCEFFSAFALRQVIPLVRSVRERVNPGLRYRLLLTMVDLRNAMHRSLAEEIRLAFGAAVFRSAIEVDARLRESPAFGKPITEYAPASRCAGAAAEELCWGGGAPRMGGAGMSPVSVGAMKGRRWCGR